MYSQLFIHITHFTWHNRKQIRKRKRENHHCCFCCCCCCCFISRVLTSVYLYIYIYWPSCQLTSLFVHVIGKVIVLPRLKDAFDFGMNNQFFTIECLYVEHFAHSFLSKTFVNCLLILLVSKALICFRDPIFMLQKP
jgi:hypothetical protein